MPEFGLLTYDSRYVFGTTNITICRVPTGYLHLAPQQIVAQHSPRDNEDDSEDDELDIDIDGARQSDDGDDIELELGL
eukprot:COSAG05_NODE_3021_length_2409_cov_12.291342_2_plen_78_part_00